VIACCTSTCRRCGSLLASLLSLTDFAIEQLDDVFVSIKSECIEGLPRLCRGGSNSLTTTEVGLLLDFCRYRRKHEDDLLCAFVLAFAFNGCDQAP